MRGYRVRTEVREVRVGGILRGEDWGEWGVGRVRVGARLRSRSLFRTHTRQPSPDKEEHQLWYMRRACSTELRLGLTTRFDGASSRGDAADLKLSFRSTSEREGGGAGTVTPTPTPRGAESIGGCAEVDVMGDEAAARSSAR